MTAPRFEDTKIQLTKNPMTAVYGLTPGATCGACVFLDTGSRARFFKCQKRKRTNGAATDHRKGWPACGLFRRGLRSWTTYYFTRAERRALTIKARVCRRTGHLDRYVELFGHWMPRCSRCLTFPVSTMRR